MRLVPNYFFVVHEMFLGVMLFSKYIYSIDILLRFSKIFNCRSFINLINEINVGCLDSELFRKKGQEEPKHMASAKRRFSRDQPKNILLVMLR